jgi:hypothetical protein
VLYKLIIARFHDSEKSSLPKFKLISSFLVLTTGIVLAARGGVQPIPISVTNAYYSNSQILNDLSVNSIWSFVEMSINYNKSNSEQFFTSLSEEESKQLVGELFDYQNAFE